MKRVVILVTLIVLAFIIFLSFSNSKTNDLSWDKLYLQYLKSNEYKSKIGISFIQVENYKDPVMLVNYDNDTKKYNDIYYIKDGNVNAIIIKEPNEIALFYNNQKNIFSYYLCFVNENENFVSINSLIKGNNSVDNPEYTFLNNPKEVTLNDGSKDYIKDSSTSFVIVQNLEYIYLDSNLKNVIDKAVSNYHSMSEILTQDIKSAAYDKQNYYKNLLTTSVNNDLKDRYDEIVGLWYNSSMNFFIEIGYLNDKKYFSSGWYASEGDIDGEIKDIEFNNEEVKFSVKKTDIVLNISKLKDKKIIMNDKTYNYIAENLDAAQDKLWDMIN